jgi:hypothetical protein
MIIITILLNALCQSGMGIVSWIIVFIPFIFMSVIVAILLYVFGLDAATGKLNFTCDNDESTEKGGNLIYSSSNKNKQVKFVDVTYSDTPAETTETIAPIGSSDPQFE